MSELNLPDVLKNKSFEEVLQEMFSILPDDIDKSEGSFQWDFTAPTALIVSKMCEQVLPSMLALIWPEFSYGEYLDHHAKTRAMRRKPAVCSNGYITITGTVGTFIPSGYSVSDISENGVSSVEYKTTEDAEIQESGTVTVPIICKQAGTIGNALPGTLIVPVTKISGITAITNENSITGGTEEETDDELKARIMYADLSGGESYVGNVSDYKRWAMSVPGVGNATVIPAQDTTGTVKIVLTDSSGNPASETLRTSVYNYIMQPDYPLERLAPPNAVLDVISPTIQEISVSAIVELKESATIESVKSKFLLALNDYMVTAISDGEIKYTKVASVLSSVDGLNDYKSLLMNNATSNIPITSLTIPSVTDSSVTLTEGDVS